MAKTLITKSENPYCEQRMPSRTDLQVVGSCLLVSWIQNQHGLNEKVEAMMSRLGVLTG